MSKEEYLVVSKNDFIRHKIFGLCIVENLSDTGLHLKPVSMGGIVALKHLTKLETNSIFEHDLKLIKRAYNPDVPYLIINNDLVFEVHYWIKPGVINHEGVISAKLFKTFITLKDAMKFCENNKVSSYRFFDKQLSKPWQPIDETKWINPFK